ncbi:MAG: hypothetical protein M1821_003843 [Bathelium mastoideum]|nr:MAG: hypothetical protein M1821_003843 [Bathelium mastoideum]
MLISRHAPHPVSSSPGQNLVEVEISSDAFLLPRWYLSDPAPRINSVEQDQSLSGTAKPTRHGCILAHGGSSAPKRTRRTADVRADFYASASCKRHRRGGRAARRANGSWACPERSLPRRLTRAGANTHQDQQHERAHHGQQQVPRLRPSDRRGHEVGAHQIAMLSPARAHFGLAGSPSVRAPACRSWRMGVQRVPAQATRGGMAACLAHSKSYALRCWTAIGALTTGRHRTTVEGCARSSGAAISFHLHTALIVCLTDRRAAKMTDVTFAFSLCALLLTGWARRGAEGSAAALKPQRAQRPPSPVDAPGGRADGCSECGTANVDGCAGGERGWVAYAGWSAGLWQGQRERAASIRLAIGSPARS